MKRLAILLLALWAVAAGAAEGVLRDPTRPPEAGAVEAGGGALRLDAVWRPAVGRPSAVINGETVVLGGEIQGRKLVAIREASVVLDGAEGRETLMLVPGVEKTMRSTRMDRPGSKSGPGGGR